MTGFPFFQLWYLPIGITHGNVTLIEERIAYISGKYLDWWMPSMWFGFFLAIASFLAFFFLTWNHKRHTKNLLTLALLILVFQFIHYIREVLKGGPIKIINEEWFWQTPDRFKCSVLFLWFAWVEASDYAASLGIFILLGASVAATRKDGQYLFVSNSHLFKKILKFVFIYPLAYVSFVGIFVYFFSDFVRNIGSCGPTNPTGAIFGIIENIFFASVDAYVIASYSPHFYRALKATSSCAQGVSDHNRGFGRLYRLLFSLAFLQLFARLGYNLWYIAVALNVQPGPVRDGLWWYSTLGLWFVYFITAPLLVLIGKAAHKHHFSEDNSATYAPLSETETEMLLRVASE